MPTLNRFSLGRGTLSAGDSQSMPQVRLNSYLGTEIDLKPLCHQAPVSTFDGTLIDDKSFGTLAAQVVSVSNLPIGVPTTQGF
jgi:hypothetical protein